MITLGREKGYFLKLTQEQRRAGLYVIGNTGVGKSVFLTGLALTDIHEGQTLAVVDPHGDLLNDILLRIPQQRLNDVIYLDLMNRNATFGINLFQCIDPTDTNEVALRVSFVQHIFERVWSASTSDAPRLSEVLRNVSITLIENNLTLAEFPLLLVDPAFRAACVKNVKNHQVILFWKKYEAMKPSDQEEYRASTFNKIDSFLTFPLLRNIVGQAKTTINMSEIMNSKKILLIKLSPRLESITTLVGTALIGMILDAAYGRSELPRDQRKFFALYIDEAHRFAGDDIAVLLAEARKFNVACTFAHQFRQQLSEQLQGATHNAANKVVFQIAAVDKDDLSGIFDATPLTEVVSREEVLVPRKSVLTHLMISGHESDHVTDFTIKYLVPFNLAIKEEVLDNEWSDAWSSYTSKIYPNSPFSFRYRYDPKDMEKAMIYLNEFLYLYMTHKHDQASKAFWEARSILLSYLGCRGYFNCEVTERNPAEKWLKDPERPKEKKRYDDFYNTAYAAARDLELLPIMEGSGRYTTKTTQQQTYADMGNQIGNDLVKLPPYTAKVKLGNSEHTIKTLSLIPISNGVNLSDILTFIAENNLRDGYLRAVLDIEEEINSRRGQSVPRLTSKQTL